MFDIIGCIALRNAPVENSLGNLPFNKEPWAGAKEIVRRQIKESGLNVTYLQRKTDTGDYAFHNGKHLFIAGEVFARIKTRFTPEKSDSLSADILIREYLQRGIDVLEDIKGNFALIIIDGRAKSCQIISSRFFILPFYYAFNGGMFYFSTALSEIAQLISPQPEIDLTAIAEIALLHFPIGKRTLFRRIACLTHGTIISVSEKGVDTNSYFDLGGLYETTLMKKEQALVYGSELFSKCVNTLSNKQGHICASFTAGFDSRAILSILDKDPNQILAYSFGIPGSFNISIPEKICHKLGINYLPLYLDKDYEEKFNDYAINTLILSDGATAERANYLFAFQKLSKFSPIVMTGLFGEIMKPFIDAGNQFVAIPFIKANLSASPAETLLASFKFCNRHYFNKDVVLRCVKEITRDILQEYIERYKKIRKNNIHHAYLFKESISKYLGAELQSEKIYAVNRFPFLDDDFIEFAFKAPFAGMHIKDMAHPSHRERLRSLSFYTYTINKYKPQLLYAVTSHGYAPRDLLLPFGFLKAAASSFYLKTKTFLIKYREFKTEEWTEGLYRRHLFGKTNTNNLFSIKLKEDFETGAWKKNRFEFAKAAALKLYFDSLGIN